MARAPETILRGRCRCGQRYRIRHPQPGRVVHCPKCGRPIIIRPEDITAARSGLPLAPDQPDGEPLDAIPLDGAELRLAPAGAAPGLTDRLAIPTDDVAVSGATRTLRLHSGPEPSAPVSVWDSGSADEGGFMPLLKDLALGFVLAGRAGNLRHLLLRTAICTGILWALIVAPGFFRFIVGWVIFFGVLLYAVRFVWGTLTLSAAGEDDLAGLNEDWSWLADAVLPALWLTLFTAASLAPWGLVTWFVPATQPARPAMQLAALALGVFFWPAMVLAANLVSPLAAVRPDILIRVVLGIGPAYLLAWLVVLATFVLWLGMLWSIGWLAVLTPLPGVALLFLAVFTVLYSGYVTFRSLGVLYRHRSDRFDW